MKHLYGFVLLFILISVSACGKKQLSAESANSVQQENRDAENNAAIEMKAAGNSNGWTM